jgi:hypothetical protein
MSTTSPVDSCERDGRGRGYLGQGHRHHALMATGVAAGGIWGGQGAREWPRPVYACPFMFSSSRDYHAIIFFKSKGCEHLIY